MAGILKTDGVLVTQFCFYQERNTVENSLAMSLELIIDEVEDRPMRNGQNLGQVQNLMFPGQIWTIPLQHHALLPVFF